MSDAAGGAPAGDAPVATEGGESAAPVVAKPRTPDDDFEDVLKKAGGLKYKAGGKEKAIGSVADLRRMLSRIDGTDSAATEAIKVKQIAAERDQKVAGLAKMKPLERIEALRGMGFDPNLIREAIEESILAEDDKHRQQATMTDRERQMARQLEERDNELRTHREQQEQAKYEAEQSRFMAENDRLYGELESAAMEGFKMAGLHAGKDSPLVLAVLPALGAELDRAKRLGLELNPADIAEAVTRERAKLSDDWNSARPLEDLSASLGAMECEDPSNPGKKTSKLKLLMLHEAAKIRASRGAVPGESVARQVTNGAHRPQGQTEAEKMAFWRGR